MNLTDQAINEAFARHHDLYAKARWTIESHVGWWELALRAFGSGATGSSADDFGRLFDDLRRFWQVFRSPKTQPPKPEAVWAILSSLDPTVRALRLRDLDAAGLPGLRRMWSVLEAGARIKQNQDGPSVMAATKFLHFWNPSLFVIVDRGEMAEWVLAHDWIKRPIMRVAEELPDDLRRRAKYTDVPLGCDLRDVPAILLWGSRVVARNTRVVDTFARYVQRSVPRASALPLATYDAAALEWLLLGLVQVPPAGVTSCTSAISQVRLEFDLATDSASWSTGFADYPVSSGGTDYELRSGVVNRPADVGTGSSVMLSGNNHSDDLFMFMKRRITGLEPSGRYRASFSVELASNAPPGRIGVGGAPGESVWVKAGLTANEPQAVDVNGDFRMNIDKGNQSIAGRDAAVLGDVSKKGKDKSYEVVRRDNAQTPLAFEAAADGSAWIMVGTDSGFEATTTLYYLRVVVTLDQVP